MENQFDFIIEDIESVEQLEDFNDEIVYDVEVDDDSHTFIANDILVHNSVYTTFGTFFECMTPEWHQRYPTERDKVKWIVDFSKGFMDDQHNEWCNEIYTPRHAKSVHAFELELVNTSQINLKKKKYMKNVLWEKGKWYDHPKTKGTGIELIKSTTPSLCRQILEDLINLLIYDYSKMSKEEFTLFFNEKLNEYRKQFYAAPIETISQSIGVNGYTKYVLEDGDNLRFAPKATPGVKACALYNHLAHKNGHDELRVYSGKIKYYNIRVGTKKDDIGFFGYPSGQLPEWAPKMDYITQWNKTIIEPINRFLEVMQIPAANPYGVVQGSLFGF